MVIFCNGIIALHPFSDPIWIKNILTTPLLVVQNQTPLISKRKVTTYKILQKTTIFDDFEGFADIETRRIGMGSTFITAFLTYNLHFHL